jgi:hypothetical protein
MGLSGSTIASTFIKLLRINSDTMGAGATASYIQDSADTDSNLAISQDRVGIGIAAPLAVLSTFGGVNSVPPTASDSVANAIVRLGGVTGDTAGHALDIGQTNSGTDRFWIQTRNDVANMSDTTYLGLTLQELGGPVGIGTDTPGVWLASGGASATYLDIYNSGQAAVLSLAGNIATDAAIVGIVQFVNNDNNDFANNDANGKILASIAVAVQSDGNAGNDSGGDMYLNTKVFEGNLLTRMTIKDTGNVGIGVTDPDTDLEVAGVIKVSGSSANLRITADSATDGAMRLENGGTLAWRIWNDAAGHSSGVANTLVVSDTGSDDGVYLVQTTENQWATFSDERSKTSLTPIESAVDKLNTLQAVNYKWKYGNEKRRTRNNLGLLAQEVNEVFPEAVVSCDESLYKVIDHPVYEGEKKAQGQWGLAPTTLIPVLVKAIQELSAKVTVLEGEDSSSDTKIAALEAKDVEYATTITALTARITALENA